MKRSVLLLVALAIMVGAGPASADGVTVTAIKVKTEATNAVAGFGSVWVLSQSNRSFLTRIDPATNAVVGTVPLGFGQPTGNTPFAAPVVAAGGSMWVAEYFRDQVFRIDPTRMRVVQHLHVGTGPGNLTAEPAHDRHAAQVFAADSGSSAITRIDTGTDKVAATYPVGRPDSFSGGPASVSYAGGRLFVTVPAAHAVVVLNAATGRVRSRQNVAPAAACGAVLPIRGGFWIDDTQCSNSVYRYDLATRRVTKTVNLGDAKCLFGASVHAGTLYIAENTYEPDTGDCDNGAVVQRNGHSGAVQTTYPVGGTAANPTFIGSDLWAPDLQNTAYRIATGGGAS